MLGIIAVGVGGALGAAARYGVSCFAGFLGLVFPFGTVAVNLLGSFFIALLACFFQSHAGLPHEVKLFAVTGVLGGFTTFSTYSLELWALFREAHWGMGGVYALLNIAGSFLFCMLGWFLGNWFWLGKGV